MKGKNGRRERRGEERKKGEEAGDKSKIGKSRVGEKLEEAK